MLYNRNQTKQLDGKLFESPTAEYRGTPFWAWNTNLDKDELLWQIERLKEMGFGGFHMHPRAGMATTYLSEDFMALVKACCQKAKQENMLTWLYDEDRWPSGFAGGYVTKNPAYRRKNLLFTVKRRENAVDAETGARSGEPYLLACYDIELNADGTLKRGDLIAEDAEAHGTKWYVYVCTMARTGRFNGQTYVDTLDKEAIREFIRVTYDAYDKAVGEEFGKNIPSIFTDEPQFFEKQALPYASSTVDIGLPYTTDLAETFKQAYGIELLPKLPELLWDLPNGEPSRVRYLYHDHICERFTEAFSDQCGEWCDKHGFALTGHLMREDTLLSQTNSLGEAMRPYRTFGLPGIDVLCDETLLATAKQCQSAVHQYAREGMLSELYGVTGWDFDFRGHKYQGDWQAALGVTIRVPHLSWVSMKGSAKRDYPASISYQSSWYKEYPLIENHFARLNTALTRGKPAVKVAVLHPIESYWLHYGPQENTAALRNQLQQNFDRVTEWLLFGTVDFDYISESLLPAQFGGAENGEMHVGAMNYEAVVVPALETMRSTTLDVLEKFLAAGGKVIFMGDCPKYIDAVRSDAVRDLYERSERIPFSAVALLDALESEREIAVKNQSGAPTNDLLYQMRIDGDARWLFLAHGRKPAAPGRYTRMDPPPQELQIYIKGEYRPTVYDSMTGKIDPAAYEVKDGTTVVRFRLYALDSLLLKLEPLTAADAKAFAPQSAPAAVQKACIDFKKKVGYTLSEPNVLVLDMAAYSNDGVSYSEPEELLRLDKKLRRELGFPMADGQDMQPWLIEEETITHFPYLKFEFDSETEADCKLAYEEACEVVFNGENVPIVRDGFFTDKDIHTMPMPRIRKGRNVLIVRAPLGKRVSLENYFLLGMFGVRVEGCQSTVTALPETIAFGSVTHQGLPFYGANITYHLPFEAESDCDVTLACELYRGALISAQLDGEDIGRIALSPYRLNKSGVKAGAHTLDVTLFGTRVNCFNGLHNCSNAKWIGPQYWYSDGMDWAYEYQLKELGILKSPVITLSEPVEG